MVGIRTATCGLVLTIVLTGVGAPPRLSARGGAARTPRPETIKYPGGKPPSSAQVELGRQLFFDKRLSANRLMSCATCHQLERGFGDGLRLSVGVTGKEMKRHTPHLFNLAWAPTLFWDGRAISLEDQALAPIQAPDELGLPIDEAVKRLEAVPDYRAAFAQLFPRSGVTPRAIAAAIAAFERTIMAADSAFDRYEAGETSALSASAVSGMALFFGRAQCSTCHSGPTFTDGLFHNTGVRGEDRGRAAFDRVGEFQMRPYPFFQTQKAFKTPGLRNVALTAPYLHDGSEPTLADVVRFYNQGGKDRPTAAATSSGLSLDVRPLHLSDTEMADLVAFLESLTSPVTITRPVLPPDGGALQILTADLRQQFPASKK